MLSPSNLLVLPLIAAASALGSLVVIPTNPRPFMTVHEVSYKDGEVTARRTVHGENARIADWRVTVVADGRAAPSCQTVAGPSVHQGWSPYNVGTSDNTMPLDVWVGDFGCYDRLEAGPHLMFVTWTPRDSSPPVTTKVRMNFP